MVPRHEEMKREQGKVELRGAERLVSWLTAGWLRSTGWKLEVLFFFNPRDIEKQYINIYILYIYHNIPMIHYDQRSRDHDVGKSEEITYCAPSISKRFHRRQLRL